MACEQKTPKYDICLDQGQTKSFRLDFEDDNDDPIDLTGSSLKLQVKDNINSTEVLLSASDEDLTGSRIQIEDQVVDKGGAYLIIEGEDTLPLKSNLTGAQDLLRVDSNGNPIYYFRGKFILEPSVTRV